MPSAQVQPAAVSTEGGVGRICPWDLEVCRLSVLTARVEGEVMMSAWGREGVLHAAVAVT